MGADYFMTLRANIPYRSRNAEALKNNKLNENSLSRLKIMRGPMEDPRSLQLVKALKV